MSGQSKEPKLWQVFFVLGVLVVTLILGVQKAGVSGHVPLLLGTITAIVLAMLSLGYKLEEIEKGIAKTTGVVLPAVFILMVIGMVVATWIASGLIPLIMYYGIQWIDPRYFLISTFLLASIVSSFTGSSWTTGATIGVALIGVGQTLGISMPWTVGAIISGAYVGDRISPLSDNMNLSAGLAEIPLLKNVKHSLYTTIPAFLLTAVLFFAIGYSSSQEFVEPTFIKELTGAISEKFNLSLFTLTIPILLFSLIYFKIPALLALFVSAMYAALLAFFLEGVTLVDLLHYLSEGYTLESANTMMVDLFERGGVLSMLDTIGLIMAASFFGGTLEATGMIRTLSNAIIKILRSRQSTFIGTALTALLFNGLLGDQYLSVIMTSRMFKDIYFLNKIDSTNLARVVGDSSVTTSVFFPWNTCGAYFIGVLGAAPWVYVPFCFFNILSVILTILYGYFNIFLTPFKPIENEVA